MENNTDIINNINNIQETTSQTIELKDFEITDIANYKDVIEMFITLLVVFMVIVIYISYKKNINRKSKNHYENNLRNKKFIEDIYVEIGETTEKTRYFIYGRKWKKRIKNSLKNVMSKNNKKLANKIYKVDSLSVSKKLNNYEKFLQKIKNNKGRGAKYQNELWFLDHNSYYYRDEIENLIKEQQIINSKILFILGKAGSGKTNLATYIAKLISEKNRYLCIYMNAKEIKDGNIEKYFKKFFYTDIIINEEKERLIYLYLNILKLFKRKVYIIVEALNENIESNFAYNLAMFINKYSKYSNFRYIITSRIEFFDMKYKKIIDEHLVEKYEMIEMDSIKINEIMKDRMIEKYRNYYNYTGKYNERVKSIIEETPILMRIFFETYRESNKNVNDLNKYTLFWNYIENVQERTTDIHVEKILYEIGNKMLELNKFDCICINDIDVNKNQLSQLINENVLLSNSIIKNQDSLEEEIQEVVMFTFDELRDFLISRILVDNKNDKDILEFITRIIENKEVIAEGVYRNLYLNYKIKGNEVMCNNLLNMNTVAVTRGPNYYKNRFEDSFENFILDIIFQSNSQVFKCEIDYINNITISKRDTLKIIRDLWKNTLDNCKPNFDIISEELVKIRKNKKEKSFLRNLEKEDYENVYEMLVERNDEKLSQLAIEINNILGVLYEEANS